MGRSKTPSSFTYILSAATEQGDTKGQLPMYCGRDFIDRDYEAHATIQEMLHPSPLHERLLESDFLNDVFVGNGMVVKVYGASRIVGITIPQSLGSIIYHAKEV